MREVYEFLKLNNLIDEHDYVVVAVSGGPDSMALLSLLLQFRDTKQFEIVCAHVNHNVRKESNEEQKFVSEFCIQHNVIFESMKIEEYEDDNFHNQARMIRYGFFESLLKKYHSHLLFTAHHGDDLMETILMRIVRGSTLKGYGGFEAISKRSDYQIVRPLIFTTKKEILEYLQNHKIPYVIDQSNTKDVYTRNRFRKKILPPLKEEDESVHRKFYKFSKTIQEYQDYIDKQVEQKYSLLVNDFKISITDLKKEDAVIQKEIINRMLSECYQNQLVLITDRHTKDIFRMCNSNKSNGSISLPNGVQAIKSYDSLILSAKKSSIEPYKYLFQDYIELPNGAVIEKVTEESKDNNFVCRLSRDEVKFPLTVRTRNIGDRMEVKGLDGSKKISDILIDAKISLSDRKSWPIVVDASGTIVWIPGLKKSKFDRTKDEKYDIILKYH